MKILRELREKRGLTLEQVAEALGLRNQYVSNYELGKRKPDYDTLSKFADFYGVSVDYLLGRDVQENPPGTKAGREVTFDDFTYAMYEEGKELTEENKKKLLEMAQFFRQQQERDKG